MEPGTLIVLLVVLIGTVILLVLFLTEKFNQNPKLSMLKYKNKEYKTTIRNEDMKLETPLLQDTHLRPDSFDYLSSQYSGIWTPIVTCQTQDTSNDCIMPTGQFEYDENYSGPFRSAFVLKNVRNIIQRKKISQVTPKIENVKHILRRRVVSGVVPPRYIKQRYKIRTDLSQVQLNKIGPFQVPKIIKY